MMGSAFFTGNLNSPAAWEMDSKPTKAQGPMATMVNTPMTGDLPGAKAGLMDENPPGMCRNTAPAQKSTPAQSTNTITICTSTAALRFKHRKLKSASAPTASSTSPR